MTLFGPKWPIFDPFLTHFGPFLGPKITFFQHVFVVLSLLKSKNHVFFRNFFGIFLKKRVKNGSKKGHFWTILKSFKTIFLLGSFRGRFLDLIFEKSQKRVIFGPFLDPKTLSFFKKNSIFQKMIIFCQGQKVRENDKKRQKSGFFLDFQDPKNRVFDFSRFKSKSSFFLYFCRKSSRKKNKLEFFNSEKNISKKMEKPFPLFGPKNAIFSTVLKNSKKREKKQGQKT